MRGNGVASGGGAAEDGAPNPAQPAERLERAGQRAAARPRAAVQTMRASGRPPCTSHAAGGRNNSKGETASASAKPNPKGAGKRPTLSGSTAHCGRELPAGPPARPGARGRERPARPSPTPAARAGASAARPSHGGVPCPDHGAAVPSPAPRPACRVQRRHAHARPAPPPRQGGRAVPRARGKGPGQASEPPQPRAARAGGASPPQSGRNGHKTD